MRILSLNVNDFGGMETLQGIKKAYGSTVGYRIWDSIDKSLETQKILEYVLKKAPDIAVLQEFERGTLYAKRFMKEMEFAGYDFPRKDEQAGRRPSMVEVFIRKGVDYDKLLSPHPTDGYWPRTCVIQARDIQARDLVICGTHTHMLDPDERDYAGKVGHWDELIRFYHKHKDQPVLIIGDLNVYKDGTPSKEKFLELKAEGAIDAWTESGHPNDTVTHKISRIDYAMMSPSMYKRMTDIDIDRTLWDRKMTDHAAIIIDLADA